MNITKRIYEPQSVACSGVGDVSGRWFSWDRDYACITHSMWNRSLQLDIQMLTEEHYHFPPQNQPYQDTSSGWWFQPL